MSKITIAIPNFNGRFLLEKNLPSVMTAGADEVLILDDGSKDNSVDFLKEYFPKVKLIVNKENRGFLYSINKLVKEAEGEIVVLLNSDVAIDKNFLKPLIKHFEKEQVFAVNCHEKGEGWSEGFWQNGFYEFKRGKESSQAHKSSWASGGSAAYSRRLWLELGGSDPIYTPGYWDDIDFSYRALKAGYEVLWEPDSLIYHQHESTMGKVFNKKKLDRIKQRNQLLFIWKNITDKKLIWQHRKALLKRLFGGVGFGYWIPFLMALMKLPEIKKYSFCARTDLEVIDYVRS